MAGCRIHIDVGCTFEFRTEVTTHAIVMVEPHASEVDRVSDARFTVAPATASSVYTDSFDNGCRRVDLAAGLVVLSYDARVRTSGEPDPVVADAVEVPPGRLPDDALMFVLPSRYCQSDQIADVAFGQFGAVPPGWSRVQAISDWVHDGVRFDYAGSSPDHTAMDVLASRVGVCRDFTHLGITLCRALNIPARYVFGYIPDVGVAPTGAPMDFCAWMEVYLGDRWHTFDPRNNVPRTGRVVIGRGRDAADVAMVTTFGQVELVSMTVRADAVAEADLR